MTRRVSAERMESVQERSSVQRFLTDHEFMQVRNGIAGLYQQRGFVPAPGLTPAEDFMRQAFKVIGDDSMPPSDKLDLFAGITGLDRREASAALESFTGMFYSDQLALRGAGRDESDTFRDGGLPDSARFKDERTLGHGSDDARRNAVELAFEKHGLSDEKQRRPVDSSRHMAVREALDKQLGGRSINAYLDNVDVSSHATREAEAHVAARESYQPTLTDSVRAAFEQHVGENDE